MAAQEKGEKLFQLEDLGDKPEPVILFGGPYSNLEALEALLEVAKSRYITGDNLISTGDVVAYCADGQACVDLVRAEGIHVVAGNCEKQLAAGEEECGCGFEEGSTCSILSRGWYAHARATVSKDNLDWMGACPDGITFTQSGKRIVVLHGGVANIAQFIWSTSPVTHFEAELGHLKQLGVSPDIVLAGHSGIAFCKDLGQTLWVNVGAVGMPENDGKPETRFAVLSGGEVAIEPLSYHPQRTASKMKAAGLTQGYDVALTSGWWPSEDVLPAALRRAFV